jgi:hypothetical protein
LPTSLEIPKPDLLSSAQIDSQVKGHLLVLWNKKSVGKQMFDFWAFLYFNLGETH